MSKALSPYHQPTIGADLTGLLACRTNAVLIGLFAALTCALLLILDPATRIANSADSATWYGPAKALLSHGMFGSFADPGTPSADRGPVYPLILAAMMRLAGDNYPNVLALVQSVLLLIAGLFTAAIAESFRKGTAPLALGLMLFNPNLVGAAQLVQSEITYLVMLTALLFFALRAIGSFSLRDAIATGAFTGLAALTRPEGAFLIVCVPLGLLLAALIRKKFGNHKLAWRETLTAVASCLLASTVVVSPWVMRNINVGIGLRINETQNSAYYAWGAVEQVMVTQTGKSFWDVPKSVTAEREKQISEFKTAHPEASTREIANRDFRNALTTLASLPLVDHIKTIAKAKAEYVFAGGTGTWIGLLRGTSNTPVALMKLANSNTYWSGWLNAMTKYSVLDIGLTAVTLGFVLILRLLALAGIVRLWQSARLLLFVLLAGIAFQALIQPYYGPSRFRLPVEPAFVLLAVAAFPLPTPWSKRKTGSGKKRS